jgi:hypothetical protein
MYRQAFARRATKVEIEEALRFLDEQATTYGIDHEALSADPRPWKDLCHTLFNMKEFIHIL